MSLFDELAAARAEAVAAEGEHTTRVPSWPAQLRAVWKPLDDPSSLGLLVASASSSESAETAAKKIGPRMVSILQQSLLRFEATEDGKTWAPVLGANGEPLLFDEPMAKALRAKGHDLPDPAGVVTVALAMCGGPAGLIELAGEVSGWQWHASDRIAEATEGQLAARQKTPVTAPPSE